MPKTRLILILAAVPLLLAVTACSSYGDGSAPSGPRRVFGNSDRWRQRI